MENKHVYALLALIFILVFILSSFILFFKPLHGEAYFPLRYVEHIKENFLPIIYDDLSYGGRPLEEPFIFYYLLAFFSLISNIFIKVIPALLVASLVLITFLISRMFISEKLSLIPALIAGFIPIMFKINLISSNVLAFPILFLLLYSFAKIEKPRFLYLFLFLSFILPLTSFLSIFFIISILVYLLIIGVEKKKLSGLEREALLFSLFVNIFLTLFLFRNSLLAYGPAFIWQNIPSSILADFFKEFALIKTIGDIGLAGLFLGAIGFVFSFKEKKPLLLASFLITSLIFLWFRLVPFSLGLIIFSLTLACLSSLSLKVFFPYLKQTKFSKFKNQVLVVILVIVILTSVVPSVIAAINFESKVSRESFKALRFLKEEETATILAPYEYGQAITFLGNKNVVDSHFLLAPSPEKRLKDISLVYISQSETLVLDIFRKYNVDYFIFDNFIRKKHGVEKLVYVRDAKCFLRVFDENETQIYKVKNKC
ncbi:hypothetical protein B6U80_01395 [Candidatus Pacearchaeota archaeon ex4484_26]|nr:MAG: hypothetical protein B6U80_01395 [Candidatus Pacearchaeota archaeon ex4484_26]